MAQFEHQRLALAAAGSSGHAAILAGAIPFFGLEDHTKKYSFLNRSHQIVENQLRDARCYCGARLS
jgi:hypothetical protein